MGTAHDSVHKEIIHKPSPIRIRYSSSRKDTTEEKNEILDELGSLIPFASWKTNEAISLSISTSKVDEVGERK